MKERHRRGKPLKAQIRKLLPKSSFARSVSILAGGAAAGQVIIVLTSPLLTRLYSPEDFGLLAVYAALLSILSVIASLRYQLAIPLPERDEEASHLVALSLIIVVAISLLTTLLILFFSKPIVELFRTPALASYLWLLPVGLLLTGTYQVFNYWAIRVKAFMPIARTKISQSLATIIVQVGGYFLGPLALILGQIGGQAAGSSTLGALILQTRWIELKAIRWHNILTAASRYARFPIYSTWVGLFNTASSQLPPILFATLFNPVAAGIYMIANRVLAMPMTLVGSAMANVFLSSAVDARRNGTLIHLVKDIHEKLVHIAMPPALILLLAGPDLFDFIFGANWRQAGEFAQWMAPWIYLAFISTPLSTLFDVLEKQNHELIFQGILLTIRACTLIIGSYIGSLTLAVSLFSGGSALCYIAILAWIIRASGNRYRVLWYTTAKAFGLSIILTSPLVAFYTYGHESTAGWVTAILTTFILTAIRYFFLIKDSQSIRM